MKQQTSNTRANILKAVRFERPEYIPMVFHINPACWRHYDQNALQDLIAAHPLLFPDFTRRTIVSPDYSPVQRKDQPYTDPWGCIWETAEDGITGSVHTHPLADWMAFDQYQAPDPDRTDGVFPINWDQTRQDITHARQKGRLIQGGLPHGHTFLRLQDIRGYENLLYDMADDEPRLHKLIGMVADFNHACVCNWLKLKPDMMTYPEDLGMQTGPMISPCLFRKYIHPVYRRIMQPARDAGCIVHMHSDGDLHALADDLIAGGVDVINLQDLVNGLDWIAAKFAGRTCVELDIDRQRITPYGTPARIDAHIREAVEKIASPRGGLMLIYGLYPELPTENIRAVMDAMERYAGYYA